MKPTLGLLFVTWMILSLTGCARSVSPAENKLPIRIGGTLCTTGLQAYLDEPGVRGARVAVDELNRRGGILGRPVEFVNIDGQSDPAKVKEAAEQLVKQGVAAIVAPCDFDFGSPAAQVAQRAGIVGLSTCASSPLYSSKTLGDKQFTLSMWNTTMGAAGAEYAYKDRGWRKAYVVTDNFIEYTKSLSQYFVAHFKSLGGTVLYEETYTQGDGNFTRQLARIQTLAEPPDFFYISSYQPDLAMLIRTLREAGFQQPVIGGDSYDDPSLFKELGAKYGNDIVFVTHSWMGAEATQDMALFLRLYQQKYGQLPDTAFVATGWDSIMVLAQAMEAAGGTQGAAAAKAMENLKFNLLTGKLDWSSAETGHEPDKEAALVHVQGGTPSFIGWGRPQNIPKP